jgi:hypothetical protein
LGSRVGLDHKMKTCLEIIVLTCVRTGLPVYSVVIYLLKNHSVVEPPYTVQLPTGEIIHHFVFRNIKLWEIPPEVLLRQNLPGLLPLLPLTQGVRHPYYRLRFLLSDFVENVNFTPCRSINAWNCA